MKQNKNKNKTIPKQNQTKENKTKQNQNKTIIFHETFTFNMGRLSEL